MNLSANLFWDVDISSIDFNKHSAFVVDRVFQLGTLEDFFAVRDFYGKTKLKHIVKNLRYLDERTLSFCSIYFKIKEKDFRCYKLKQITESN